MENSEKDNEQKVNETEKEKETEKNEHSNVILNENDTEVKKWL